METGNDISRRNFIKATAAAGVAAQAFTTPRSSAQDADKTFNVALIGCGGRGNGALGNFMEAAQQLGIKARLVACADAFKDRAEGTARGSKLPPERCFWGFDAYKKVMETEADIVLMATPPGFRPLHLEAAINAGKHVFMEKPVAVDPVGCRRVIAAGELAKTKGLAIVAGTQRRHQDGYLRNEFLIRQGAVGKILGGAIWWCGAIPWIRQRNAGEDDATYMCRNWLNFTELSGDHIVEQHVHNIDVANWFLGAPPVQVLGFGGRHRRTTGNQYDFFSLDLEYADDVHIHSMCRQIAGCYSRVGEFFKGTEGAVWGGGRVQTEKKIDLPEFRGGNPYVNEHYDMIKSIMDGQPLNEARSVAEATMVAVMGRMSAYTGQLIRWKDVTENEKSEWYNFTCAPAAEDFEKGPVTAPKDDVVAISGR